jgi:restriction system protein
MNAWLVRAGSNGERDEYNLTHNVVGGGFKDVGDLSQCTDRDQMLQMLDAAYPGSPKQRISNYRGQLWALTNRMEDGDLVVLPLKTTSQLAIGKVTGPYEYRPTAPESTRHCRPVEWIRTDVARTAVQQDLLFSLGAFMTICQLSRNDAALRIKALAETGTDPGSTADPLTEGTANGTTGQSSGNDDAASVTAVDLEEYAKDRLSTVISERFAGHKMAHLVGAVLEAQGFVCDVAPEGPDGGIDIFAGRGPLGLDAPRLIVQVKSSPSAIDAPTVRELHGVISTHGADQGLMVAWGGLNKVARRELGTQRFNVRVWEANDLIEQVAMNYQHLPESIRADLPLKQIWTVIEDLAGS